jgi:hypothetical protein
MATFVRIEPVEQYGGAEQSLDRDDDRSSDRAAGSKAVNISIDVGKTLALLLLGVLVLIGALVLYLKDKNTAAAAFFALGEAIVVSGFGVVLGESSGASEAVRKLT